MTLPDIKALKKLADACRKAGIKSYKSPEFEFTLTEDAPVKDRRSKKAKAAASTTSTVDQIDKVEVENLTEEQLLMWSTFPTEGVTSENNSQ